MKHDIQLITQQNFDGVISKFRDSAVSSLWFFKGDSKADGSFLEEYNKVAGDLKGMAKVCAISCTDWPVFCDKQGVKETPSVMIYPTDPTKPKVLLFSNKKTPPTIWKALSSETVFKR